MKVTISFEARIYGAKADDRELAALLNKHDPQLKFILDELHDGRRLLEVELLIRSLNEILEGSIQHCVERKYREMFGSEEVQIGPRSYALRATMLKEEFMTGLKCLLSDLKVEAITDGQGEEE